MVRVEEFYHQSMACCRRELEGCPVEVTVESRQSLYQGKAHTRTLRRWSGLHLLTVGEEVREVDESLVTDWGPKLGISLACTPHREAPVTKAEREAVLRNVVQMAARLMRRDSL